MPRTTIYKGPSLVAFSLLKVVLSAVNDARGDGRSLSDIWASQISFNVTLTFISTQQLPQSVTENAF